jgi:starch phosphorylase
MGATHIEFAGSDNALYERHLAFDNIVDPAAIDPRERFEAFAARCAMFCRSDG